MLSAVVGRWIFYNDSSFDGNNVTANAADDAAIATDKQALLPGGTASFNNYTSYSKGINGVMVDLAGGANPRDPITAADFQFKVGNSDDPNSWGGAPQPTAVTLLGLGVDNSSRIAITWGDGVIQKEWLQVTVLADMATGLTAPDVFYFGNCARRERQ